MRTARWIAFFLVWSWAGPGMAVGTVNPNGVNVRSNGPTTVFLTFQSLDPAERAVQAFWCGAVTGGVTGGSVNTVNPCVPGTIYGVLPLRNDQSQISASGTFRTLTDIMTIPSAVTRRAFQDAQAGQSSEFFYVRQFTGGVGGDKFVVVTCRMGGGGARSPLALLDVRLAFHTANGDTPVLAVARGAPLPRFSAAVIYNGSGTLKGRWEVAMPGDPDPSERDLLTEATLPIEQRALQRRYTLIERFDLFLTPDGRTMINGPDPRRMPVQADGPYRVLLRIEASNDKEGDSNTGGGRVVRSGGVAGFPMPTLRYFVGSAQTLSRLGDAAKSASGGLALVLPVDGAMVPATGRMLVSWIEIPNVALYRVEFMAGSETVFSALVRPGAGQYDAPSFLRERPEKALKWRVLSLARTGEVIAQSGFRTLRFE